MKQANRKDIIPGLLLMAFFVAFVGVMVNAGDRPSVSYNNELNRIGVMMQMQVNR